MDAKEIAKQYEENRVKALPLLEELVEQFKKDKSSLDIQQLRLITEYLIWDREFDEDYIDELEKEIEHLKRLWNTRKERKMIEVGEYVRDNEGNIDKIINTLSLFKDVYLYLGEEGYQYSENAISKHSKNIIDLIDYGDYVNGEKIGQIENGFLWYGWSAEIDDYSTFFKEKDIETVVTKEQFASMEYKVKE